MDDRESDEAFRHVINLPARGFGAKTMAILEEAAAWRKVSHLLDVTGYRTMLRESRAETTEGRLKNVQELILLAGSFDTGRALVDHAALATENPSDDGSGRVRLMTLHKAKGLEFPHVFLPGWGSNSFPPPYGEFSEERRLAYVALTRGIRRVSITYADYRRGTAEPSPFCSDIPSRHSVTGWLRQQNTENRTVRYRAEPDHSDDLDFARYMSR